LHPQFYVNIQFKTITRRAVHTLQKITSHLSQLCSWFNRPMQRVFQS